MQTVKQDGQGAKLPAHETFRVAAVLALVGGFLDIYTYLLRGGVFANAQTGNIVLLAANLSGNGLEPGGVLSDPDSCIFRRSFCDKFIENAVFREPEGSVLNRLCF